MGRVKAAVRIRIKRAHEPAGRADGRRVLVDRVWPRGVSRESARLDDWLKDVAPSTKLRKWFGHDPERWTEFRRRYHRELDDQDERIDELKRLAKRGTLTLVFAAKDETHNNAVALKEYLTGRAAAR